MDQVEIEIPEKLDWGGTATFKRSVVADNGLGYAVEIEFDKSNDVARSSFDPWSATMKEALSFGGPQTGEFNAWLAARAIESNRQNIIEKGSALLYAVATLMNYRMRPPQWLADEYLRRQDVYEAYETPGFDEAFELERLDDRTRLLRKKHRRLIGPVHAALMDVLYRDPSRAVDNDLFEEVGEKFGIGKSQCREIYDSAVRHEDMQDLSVWKKGRAAAVAASKTGES